MKTKPTKHKEENSFKFQTFAERLSSINVDIIHQVRAPRNVTPEETDTFFWEALEKWLDLNLTEGFAQFVKAIGKDVETLAQVLLNKDRILALLKEHLEKKDPLYLQPLLELLVALTRDLQTDFHPYFSDFFNIIVSLLASKNAEQLEWAFTTLAYLYKFLWRYLVKDIKTTYALQRPLLSDRQPEHVRRFAAESFAFLGRKVLDKRAFLNRIWKELERYPEDAEGVGRLLFEIVKGVPHQFHSTVELFFALMLKSLQSNSEPVYEAVSEAFLCMARHTTTVYAQPIWNVLLKEVSEAQAESKAEVLPMLLRLLGIWLQYSGGILLGQPSAVAQTLISLLQCSQDVINDQGQEVLVELLATFFLAPQIKLPLELSSRIIRLIFQSAVLPVQCIFTVVEKLHNQPLFESHILPMYLQFVHGAMSQSDASKFISLQSVASLLTSKRPLPQSGAELLHWKPYPLEFTFAMKKVPSDSNFPQFVQSWLNSSSLQDHWENVLFALICALHIKPLDLEEVMESSRKILTTSLRLMSSNENSLKTPMASMANLALLVLATLAPGAEIDFESYVSLEDLLPSSGVTNDSRLQMPGFLRCLDIYLTIKSEKRPDSLDMDLLQRLHKLLIPNVSSSHHKLRWLTLHIFSLFHPPLPPPPPRPGVEEEISIKNVFQLAYEAECVSVGMSEYRERLRLMQHMDHGQVQLSLPLNLPEYHMLPLRYLLSVLYHNFKPVWEPTMKLIESYAQNIPAEEFWAIFLPFLLEVTEKAKLEAQQKNVGEDGFGNVDLKARKVVEELGLGRERLDHATVRYLLWQTLGRFPNLAEKYSADIVPLFLTFWRTEFRTSDATVTPTQDLTPGAPKTFDDEDEKSSKPKKYVGKTLCAQLAVFSKFQKPSKMNQETEVYPLFVDLLAHRAPDIQKAALDCVMAYKNKHLTPYKENLNKILDDRTFKYELTLFHIDTEANVVRPEHRQTLMEVLTRVLFGKMQSKTGPKSGGKSNSGYRQGLVLRFVAGCTPSEMQMFLDMAFHLFTPFLKDSVYKSVKDILDNAKPSQSLPLKRLQGALNLMGLFFGKIGHLLQSSLSYLRQILFVILAQINTFLGKLRESVAPRYLNLLKTLRQLAYIRLVQFTNKFHNYPWNADEVEALFAVAVWPQLPLLTTEAIQSPTALLKLCTAWAQNPRMFVFFAKHHPDDHSVTVLPTLLEVLTGGKAQGPVCKAILHILENLVTLADYTEETVKTSYTAKKPHRKAIEGIEDHEEVESEEEDEEEENLHMDFNPILCNFILSITAEGLGRFKERPNYGSLLLRPHVMSILGYLEQSVKRAAKRGSGLSPRELILLARLTEFVEGQEESGRLAILVCQTLQAGLGAKHSVSAEEAAEEGGTDDKKRKKKGKKMNEESIVYLLQTLGHLLHVVAEPNKFIKYLSPLFGVVASRTSRGALLDVLTVMGKRDPGLKELADFGADLNAYDARRVEEPDFNRRLAAYKVANEKMQSGNASRDFSQFVIYNVAYQLKTEEDMSLRDCAGACLQNFATFLQKQSEKQFEEAQFILQLLFNQVRLLVRSKKENVRHEALAILTQLIVRCNHLHPQLKDLLKLRTEDDMEADFYENIRHLQSHRRARAMSRLAAKLLADPTGKFLQADTLTQVLLPIVSCVFFNEHYAKYSHMVDAAMEALGAIAKCLPWYSYDRLLRYFLGSLSKQSDFQKQAVRTTVAVLDAFHFDLSSSKLNLKEIKEESPQETEPKVEEDQNDDLAPQEIEDLDSIVDEPAVIETETEPKVTGISSKSATKIHDAIVRHLLPQLNRLLTACTAREGKHKSNRGSEHFPEDEEVLRVPLALAMVSLLKNLPKGTLERQLQGIFFKVSTFLKSKADSVRQTARETLIRIMQILSPIYLGKLLNSMKGVLQRGYQIHVLIFTMHSILRSLETQIQPGSIDNMIPALVEICKQELFGQTAEEKEVSKVKEARGVKSYDTLNLLAAKTGPGVLLPLTSPFQEVLSTTRSHQVVNKVQEALQHMATGLAANSALPVPSLLTFFYGIVSQSIPQLFPIKKQRKKDPKFSKPDSLIIAAEPKRFTPAAGSLTQKGSQANAHVLVEFGLHSLHMILKKDRIQVEDATHLSMIDPFIPLLTESLQSPYPKIISLSLRCLTKMMRWTLPSIQTHIQTLAEFLFLTLNKYAGTTGQGEIADMVHAAFKAVTVLVRDIPSYSLSEEQLRVLLTYAESGLTDPQRQTLGFGVFRAILKRKLIAPELPPAMERLAKLSITSEADFVRGQARQVVLQFFLDYPLGAKLIKHLEFYLAQLHYEFESGRLSAIEMFQSVVSSFPRGVINQHASLIFVHLAPVVVNDASALCSKNAAQVIKSLIQRADAKQTNVLFSLVLAWLNDAKWAHKRLAAQLAGLFVEAETTKFENRLESILTPLSKLLDPDNVCEDTHTSDHVVIQALTLLLKIGQNCSSAMHNAENTNAMTTIWGYVQEHLLHPHAWVRLLAARSIGLLFSFHNPEVVVKKASEVLQNKAIDRDESPKKKKKKSSGTNPNKDKGKTLNQENTFLINEEISEKLRSLAADCLAQLQSQLLDDQLAEQVVKNLIYLAKISVRMPQTDLASKNETENENEEEDGESETHQDPGPPTVKWLIRRLRGEINQEVAVNPKYFIKRTSAFKWMAALSVDIAQLHGSESVLLYLGHLLPPLARELGDDGAPEPVRELAQEVADLIKGLVGQEVFATQLVAAQRTLYQRRGERKIQRASRAVTNPVLAAKLKMKKQSTKKEAKKRKMANLRGKKVKRPKLRDLAFAED